ncbi:hypothetical protein KBX26_10250 [Micromonospora sp. C97]|uniref:TY-Chap domain-containing protein n=1 Tax=Micromonospora sp. C97 TaxID=2824883 RepID=UPI001B37ABD8|nr:hypothetical protein [Micromonospora sp. C97]MBQ1030378.1 hypothetical protein [Micromonospora sp. C97]
MSWIMAVYFPRGRQSYTTIKSKFADDSAGIAANGVDGITFVCNQELSLSERAELRATAGGKSDIYHLERIVAILDQPKMRAIRAQFLGLDSSDAGQASVGVALRRQLIRERIDLIARAIEWLAAKPKWRPKRDSNFFILDVHGIEGIYAQFMRSVDGVYVELVSSRFLAPWHRLSQAQEELLSEHGWKPPDKYAPNFHQDFSFPGDRTTFSIDIAKNVLDTLIHVYGIHETDPLVIRPSGDD